MLVGYMRVSKADGSQTAFAGEGDVSNQPPVYIVNSHDDSLRASGEKYAQQLHEAGVDVVAEVEADARHGHLDHPHSAEGKRTVERIATWIATHTGTTTESQ
jgi:acetyl esterase